jgi:hypothetical protein
MNELQKYPHNIYNLKMIIKNEGSWINVGTFKTETALKFRHHFKKCGYNVKLRGRGDRKGKRFNDHKDISIYDAEFLAVYAHKKSKRCGSCGMVKCICDIITRGGE